MDASLQDSLGRPVEEEYDSIVATGGELNRVKTRSLEEDLCNLPSSRIDAVEERGKREAKESEKLRRGSSEELASGQRN